MSMRTVRAGILAALVTCTAGGVFAQDTGSFEATVVLGSEAPVTLTGYCTSSAAPGGWYAHMLTPGGGSTIMLLYAGAAPPPTGEYEIEDFVGRDAEPLDGEFLATGSTDEQLFVISGFHSVSGTLVVTASGDQGVAGTFSFSARETGGRGRLATVEGTFISTAKDD